MVPRTVKQIIAANNRPDMALEITARIARLVALRQAHEETRAKFAVITPENIDAALEFQERRAKELGA